MPKPPARAALEALPHLGEQVGEHEDEHQRVHHRADEERNDFAAQHADVAQQAVRETSANRACS